MSQAFSTAPGTPRPPTSLFTPPPTPTPPPQLPPTNPAADFTTISDSERAFHSTTAAAIDEEIARRNAAWSKDGLFKTLGKFALEQSSHGLLTGLDYGPRTGTDAVLGFMSDTGLGMGNLLGDEADPTKTDAGNRLYVNRDRLNMQVTGQLFDPLRFALTSDPSFTPTERSMSIYAIDDQGNLLDDRTIARLSQAGSEYEMALIRARALREQEVARRRSGMGTALNFGISMAAGFTDPVLVGSGMVAGGIGGSAGAALGLTTTASALRNLAARGLIAGVENVGQSVVLSGVAGTDYSWNDATRDAGLGMVFSSILGVGGARAAAERALVRQTIAADARAAKAAGAVFTEKGTVHFREVPGFTPTSTIADMNIADEARVRAYDAAAVNGERLAAAPEWVRGREVRVDGYDGVGRVKEIAGRDLVIEHGGREIKIDMDAVRVAQGEGMLPGARVRFDDGTLGTIERVSSESSPPIGQEVRVPRAGDAEPMVRVIGDDGATRTIKMKDLLASSGEAVVRKGQASIDATGKWVLAFGKSRDASTLAHEHGHPFRRTLRQIDTDLADAANDHYAQGSDSWSVEAEEAFANDFTRYLKEGKAPTRELGTVFERFAAWLSELSASIRETLGFDAPLTDRQRAVFGALLDAHQNRQVVGELGAHHRAVRSQLHRVLGRREADGSFAPTDQSRATEALLLANARAVSRATGRNIDDYFRDVIVGYSDSLGGRSVDPVAVFGQDAPPEQRPPDRLDFTEAADRTADAATGVGVLPRIDRGGRVKRFNLPVLNSFFNTFFADPMLDTEGARAVGNAESAVHRIGQAKIGAFQRTITTQAGQWAAQNKVPLLKRAAAQLEFRERVGRAVRDRNFTTEDPILKSAVESARLFMREIGQFGKDNEIKAFETFDLRDDYLSRSWVFPKIHALVKRHGIDEVVNALSSSIRAARPTLTAEEARVLGLSFYKRITRYGRETDFDKNLAFGGLTDRGHLMRVLEEEGVAPDVRTSIADKLAVEKNSTGLISSARRRTLIDENYTHTTAKGGTFSIADMLDNDALAVGSKYAHSVIAESAVTQGRKAFAAKWNLGAIESDTALLAKVHDQLVASGKLSDKQINATMDHLQSGFKRLRGLPLDDRSTINDVMWRWRQFASTVYNGSFGVPAFFEGAHAIARTGVRDTIAGIPALRVALRALREGKTDDPGLSFIFDTLGVGNDTVMNRIVSDFETGVDPYQTRSEGFWNGADKTLMSARKFTTRASGMPLATGMSRVMVANGMMRRMHRQAKGGTAPSAKRLAWLGMDRARWNAVAEQLKSHADSTRASFDPGIDRWTDLQAKHDFIEALRTNIDTVVQEGGIGASHPWLEHEWSKTLFQFRQFNINAYTKQLLAPMQIGDSEAWLRQFTAALPFSVAQYLAVTLLNSAGRDDRDEWIRKQLTPERIAAAAFARSSFASLPAVGYDTAARMLGYQTLGGSRSTGLDADPVFGNPTLAIYNRGLPAIGGSIRSVFDPGYDLSRENLRGLRLVTPMGRLPGMSYVFNAIGDELPARSVNETNAIFGEKP